METREFLRQKDEWTGRARVARQRITKCGNRFRRDERILRVIALERAPSLTPDYPWPFEITMCRRPKNLSCPTHNRLGRHVYLCPPGVHRWSLPLTHW